MALPKHSEGLAVREQDVGASDGVGVRLVGTRTEELEERLKAALAEFRALADNIPQLAWMADGTGSIYWYNRRWYEYTGTTPDQMEGWGWQTVHDPATLPAVLERWRRSLATSRYRFMAATLSAS
jgi:PAS domain-containing protein